MLVFCVCVRFSPCGVGTVFPFASDLLPVCCRFVADLLPICLDLLPVCRRFAADLTSICCRPASDLRPVCFRSSFWSAAGLLPICLRLPPTASDLLPVFLRFAADLTSICCRSAFYVPVSVNMLPLFCRFRAGVSPIACRRLRSASVASAPYATGFVLRWLGFRFCRVSCRCRASSAFRLPFASVSAYAGIPFFRSNPGITPTRRPSAVR